MRAERPTAISIAADAAAIVEATAAADGTAHTNRVRHRMPPDRGKSVVLRAVPEGIALVNTPQLLFCFLLLRSILLFLL